MTKPVKRPGTWICRECGKDHSVPHVEEVAVEGDDALLKFTGLDSAIIGITDSWQADGTHPSRLVYSGEKIMEIFVSRDGMDHDEAHEFISFNTEGAYVGPHTPVVVWPYDEEEHGPLGDDD